MSLTYGYFDSVSGDRVYTADQMSQYFKGLITDGVYQSVGNSMYVTAAGGMTVSVAAGRAIIKSKWAELDAAETLNITGADSTNPRWTAVCLTLDTSNRLIKLETVDGAAAANPVRPTKGANSLILAYIYVAGGATAITQANIYDTRPDSDLCGWITSVVQTLDTSTLYQQWYDAYAAVMQNMVDQWDAWFHDISEQLQVNTYIKEHYWIKEVEADSPSGYIVLTDGNYVYSENDIINVYINGLYETNYSIGTDPFSDAPALYYYYPKAGTKVEVVVYESKIGDPISQGATTVQYNIENVTQSNSTFTAEEEE